MTNRRFNRAVAAAIYTCISVLIAGIVYAGRGAGASPGGELMLVMVVPAVIYSIMGDEK